MQTNNLCTYGPHCRITGGLSLPTEECGAPLCSRHLHHLCQGEFETTFKHVIGAVETMGKRCLPCLLQDNNSFTKEVCSKIGCTISGTLELDWPDRPLTEPSLESRRSATTRRNSSVGASPIADSPAGRTRSRLAHMSEDADAEEESDITDAPAPMKKRGGKRGAKRAPMRRTALSLEQQAILVKHYEELFEQKPSYIYLQEWAKNEFKLSSMPSRSLVAKIIKNKTEILAKVYEATMQLDRKRKRTAWSKKVSALEEELLHWVQHHDATHGGRVPLTDAMIIQKVRISANNCICA